MSAVCRNRDGDVPIRATLFYKTLVLDLIYRDYKKSIKTGVIVRR